MKVIFKYQLNLIDKETIILPKGYKILSIQEQFSVPVVWVLVDQDVIEYVNIDFYMFSTGQIINENDIGEYVDTIQMSNGSLIWHFFVKEWD